ncbi:16S rRNA (adenine(1518)-N(6)/adenine(1519)-N(6))-dimethyltransferase RsmA [Pirellula sp. SH-Sr6A]|uniref:16S rRNA (adenine(1518)-N(6)/adenine(1519)-N(6))- dimethyltransferase RsmA n=1 Tax=Pirellula sp. SH-Sr6A TaxID=1632865 RepID=UPI001F0AFD06|nr:16S rRNA (adenine(1518)-N(6)/adenine(1519)-N(6))-dimethyltransferase RsmA [Pirellula sp. SH-Sr6A]
MSERQTYTYLSRTFEAAGMQPKTKYGQNFLIDLNILDILARGADLQRTDVILEVGTGMGSLTKRIAPHVGHMITIEIDRELQVLAARELEENTNVTMLTFDALRNKNHLRDEVMETVREKLALFPGARFKLVANLPYNVATPIISNLLSVDPLPERMVVTIQKELAERIVSPPSCKDYSALTIWMQSQCDCEILRNLPPTVFWPRPRVDSSILRIIPNAAKRERIVDLDYFHKTLRALFFHRRKFLRSQLATATQDHLSKPQVDEILAKLQFSESLRAEQLSVEQIIDLLEESRRLTPPPQAD